LSRFYIRIRTFCFMSDAVRKLYDSRSRFYDYWMGKQYYGQAVQNALKKVPLPVPSDSRILDLGCGTLLSTEALFQRFPNSKRLVGLDISKSMISEGKRLGRDCGHTKVVFGDFNRPEELKFGSGEFDLVVSTGSVSEYGNLSVVVPYVHRILSDGGVFVNIGVKRKFGNFFWKRLWKYHPAGRDGFVSECLHAGFSDVKEIDDAFLGYKRMKNTKYMVVARK